MTWHLDGKGKVVLQVMDDLILRVALLMGWMKSWTWVFMKCQWLAAAV